MKIQFILRLGAALAGFAFGLSVALTVPRMWRFDYRGVVLWPIQDGAYVPVDTFPVITDSAGVVVVSYPEPVGVRHNPMSVAYYALRVHARLNQPRERRAFWTQVEWLVENARVDERLGVRWEYDFDVPPAQRAPWISGMAQGMAISALTRAYRASGDSVYLRYAKGALRVFEIDEKDGGVVRYMGDGLAIYQEYPRDRYVVLDGWLAALAGVQELYLATGDPQAKRILDRGLHTLRLLLPQFENSFAVLYSSRRGLPRPHYFAVSYNWLRYLATYDASLAPAVKRWERHRRGGFWAQYARVCYQSLNWRLMRFRRGPDLDTRGMRGMDANAPARDREPAPRGG